MTPRITPRSKIWFLVAGVAALSGFACEDDREDNWYWPPNYESTSASRSGQAGSVAIAGGTSTGGTSTGGTTSEAGAGEAGSEATPGAAGDNAGGAGGSGAN